MAVKAFPYVGSAETDFFIEVPRTTVAALCLDPQALILIRLTPIVAGIHKFPCNALPPCLGVNSNQIDFANTDNRKADLRCQS